MTIEELAIVCRAHEGIQTGGRNCRYINEAYKLLPNVKRTATKNNKIIAINEYFDKIRAETLARLIVEKEINGKKGENIIITGITFETVNAG